MPVPTLWTSTNKAEAKYNVVTDFPQLGLHAAAASGNVGLVEYALKHGQPINSVLDGVLPIHAAAAGGHPQVVKKLIEHGADVNARRIPRRYFNDKNRDSSAPIVGTTDSTPLHFAAANGNTNVITLLLLHGAHPDRADKYGVTPEALARENNWVECANILQNWVLNKDRDLREREVLVPNGNGAASASSIPPEPESPSFRRRLHVKQSIDTALNMLKSSSTSDPSLKPFSAVSPPASPMGGEFNHDTDDHTTSRRPSLPHTLQPPPTLDELRSRNPTSSCSRRPRSAGTGAERSSENEPIYLPHGRGGSGRKLGGKLSLLNLFKKAQHADGSDTSATSTPPRPSTSSTPFPQTPSSTSLTRASPGSAAEVLDPVELHRTHRNHSSSDSSARGLRINPPPPNGRLQPPSSFLDLDSPITSSPTVRSPPPLPSALELHNVLTGKRPQGRDRSRSNATTISTLSDVESEDEQAKLSAVSKTFKPTMGNRDRSGSSTAPAPNLPDIREDRASGIPTTDEERGLHPPGILKGHRRSSSNSQSSPSPGRSLRFDPMSTPDRRKDTGSSASSSNQVPQLRGSSSSQSLRPSLREDSRVRSSPRIHIEQPLMEEGVSSSVGNVNGHGLFESPPLDKEDVEEDYPSNSSQAELKSFDTTESSSLPPLFGETTSNTRSLAAVCADLPFSIRQPPPMAPESPENSLKVIDGDRRGRGDSVSSTCTTSSTNAPQYSTSGSTIGSSASPMLSTPSGGSLPLPTARDVNETEGAYEDAVVQEKEPPKPRDLNGSATLIQRRAQSPLDIDIRDISSHAEADALVERNKQEVLAFASSQTLTSGSSLPGDATPLSARLAAYGESLALQKRLKDMETEVLGQAEAPVSPTQNVPPQSALDFHHHGVARQSSLGKPVPSRPRPRRDPRRPSTADGLQSRKGGFFAADGVGTSRSFAPASRPSLSIGSTSFEERRQLPPPTRNLTTSLSASTSLFTPPEALGACPSSARGFKVELDDDLESFASDSLVSDVEATAPVIRHVASFTSAGARNKPVPGRNAGSAKKLNRMGFTVVDQAVRPVVAAPPPPPSNKLKGGLKSFMQTLKGKT